MGRMKLGVKQPGKFYRAKEQSARRTRVERSEAPAHAVSRRDGRQTGGEVNRRSDLSRLLISEKTEYESRAIVYYRGP